MDKTQFLSTVGEALDSQGLMMTDRARRTFQQSGLTAEHLRQILLYPREMVKGVEDGYEACYVLYGEKTRKAKVGISGGQLTLIWLEYNKVPFIM